MEILSFCSHSRSVSRNGLAAHLSVLVVTFLSLVLFDANAIAQDRSPARADSSADTGARINPRSPDSTEEEVLKLKTVVADQQKRIEQLEQTLDEQKKLIELALHPHIAATRPADENSSASNLQPAIPAGPADANSPIRKTISDDQTSPLSLRIGQVSVTPYGLVDLTAIVRDKDIASGLSTNFGSIPFSNTVAGHLSEFRLTAQNTRVGARFDAHHGGASDEAFSHRRWRSRGIEL